MAPENPILEVREVSFEYPNKRALEAVSFSLYPGSVTALVGPNGSGKTTLLRCVAALDQPFSGTISIGGYDTVIDPRKCHEFLGYLSDSFGLYDDLTVEQCLLHQAAIHGLSGARLQSERERVISQVDLKPLLKQRTGSLSRGQRQRIGVALSLLHRPKVLLLDEPASGLDPEARSNLSVLFRSLKEEGLCVLVSSHILAELEDYSDRMLTLREGRIRGDESVSSANRAETVSLNLELLESSTIAENILREKAEVTALSGSGISFSFRYAGTREGQAKLLAELISAQVPVVQFAVEKESLEAVYKRQLEEQQRT